MKVVQHPDILQQAQAYLIFKFIFKQGSGGKHLFYLMTEGKHCAGHMFQITSYAITQHYNYGFDDTLRSQDDALTLV